MLTIEIDDTTIYRLEEIKSKKLHNYPRSWSGFLASVVPTRHTYRVTMAYIIKDSELIGWAYIRNRGENQKVISYESGSFVSSDHRRNGYARIALRELVKQAKSKSPTKSIEIRAQSHTKSILESFNDSRINIKYL